MPDFNPWMSANQWLNSNPCLNYDPLLNAKPCMGASPLTKPTEPSAYIYVTHACSGAVLSLPPSPLTRPKVGGGALDSPTIYI